jgi:hypothetical protein
MGFDCLIVTHEPQIIGVRTLHPASDVRMKVPMPEEIPEFLKVSAPRFWRTETVF